MATPNAVPDGMMEKKVPSVLPWYLLGAVWLVLGLLLPPYKLSHLLIIAVVSIVVFIVAKKLIPPRTVLVPVPLVAFATGEAELDAALTAARKDIAALKAANDRIPDVDLSAKISRMEKAGTSILNEVASHPEKAKFIRRFCTYYLPTSIKVLNTYADALASGSTGENAGALHTDICTNAETIASAFEQQLDGLFAADVLDVSTDLETMKTVQEMDSTTGGNNLHAEVHTATPATAALQAELTLDEATPVVPDANMSAPAAPDDSVSTPDGKITLTLDGDTKQVTTPTGEQ